VLAALLIAPQLLAFSVRGALSWGPGDDWSPSRRASYQALSLGAVPAPIGSLSLDRVGLDIPVYTGVEETALTLGAGHLPDTSPLNGPGNAAVAGHRDGFFRSLRDLRKGDTLTLRSAGATRTYRVASLWVVAPDELWVLRNTRLPALTLITCHPFTFVGHAPERFVVRAVAVPDDGRKDVTSNDEDDEHIGDTT
jgi:sortase A